MKIPLISDVTDAARLITAISVWRLSVGRSLHVLAIALVLPECLDAHHIRLIGFSVLIEPTASGYYQPIPLYSQTPTSLCLKKGNYNIWFVTSFCG